MTVFSARQLVLAGINHYTADLLSTGKDRPMTSFGDAERILRHHETALFADPNIAYASVRPRRKGDTADFVIEIGVVDLAAAKEIRQLSVPAAYGAEAAIVDVEMLESGEVVSQ